MFFYEMRLSDQVRWRLCRDDPQVFALNCFEPWVLINPVDYPQFGVNERFAGYPYYRMGMLENEILLKTNALIWGIEQQPSHNYPITLQSGVQQWLLQLRRISMQAEVSKAIVGGLTNLPQYISLPSQRVFPKADVDSSLVIPNYDWTTGINASDITKSDTALIGGDDPIYQSVLLDAFQAFAERDDKRCVLYCAMAIEIMGNYVVNTAYNMGKIARNLTRKPSKLTTVQWLFGSMGLSLLGQSLQTDDPVLYANLVQLYQARNRIVHSGDVAASPTNFNLDDGSGAFLALKIAVNAFKWYGIIYDCVPKRGFVSSHPVSGESIYIEPMPRPLLRLWW